MGNFVSCTLSVSSSKHSKSSIRVIFPRTGEIKEIDEQIKAAELMLEYPGLFLVNSISLSPGRRFSALNADEDLEKGNVYVMFPMKRVNSVVTAADMGALFLTAKRVAGFRVLPEPGVSEEEEDIPVGPKLNLDDIEDFSVMEFTRLSVSRSKKPSLETITEETVCLR